MNGPTQFRVDDDFDERRAGECSRCGKRYEARGLGREVVVVRHAGRIRAFLPNAVPDAAVKITNPSMCANCARMRVVPLFACGICGRNFSALDHKQPMAARDDHQATCVPPLKRGWRP
jgi:hypothetical protein